MSFSKPEALIPEFYVDEFLVGCYNTDAVLFNAVGVFVILEDRRGLGIVVVGISVTTIALSILLMGQWLIPFVIAFIMAYALHAPVDFVSCKLRLPRTVATGVVVLSLVVAVSTFTVFFVPLLKNAIIMVIQKLPVFLQTFPEQINTILHGVAEACGIDYTFDVAHGFKMYLSEFTTKLPSRIFTFIDTGIALAYAVMFIFITPIITFYLLKDWPAIVESIDTVLHKVAPKSVLTIMQLINTNLAAYIKGQLLVCLILSIIYFVGLWILGVMSINECIVCGVLSGACSIAPFFGPLIGLTVSLVMLFDDASSVYQYLNVVCLFVVVPFIDSNFITPKFIGRKTGIHPVGLLFMICAAGSILGLSGIFIAVPMAVVLSTLCKECIRKVRS
ncbi:MAG: AI-2E family transporter [Holosporales bacterium]|jgi:predicted PurR-regulated permease PerM|nr:AI-2E family transporter [Holosporales bacterium]